MPDILTSDTFETWLPERLLSADPQELLRATERAERDVIARFTEDTDLLDRVGLKGWKEQADGTPDVDAMEPRLVDALRDCIGRIVEHRLTAPGRHVARERQGSRSKRYRARGLPNRVYAPLRPYDERTPFF